MDEFRYVLVPCDIDIDPRNDREGTIQITFPDSPIPANGYVWLDALVLTGEPPQDREHFNHRGYVRCQVWGDLGDRYKVRIPGDMITSGSIIHPLKDFVKEE